MSLSVIIPTYNRVHILEDCLTALTKQDLPYQKFEVIVINDGSQDNTNSFLEKFTRKHANFHALEQKNQGQGIARNYGIKKAKNDIIVLMNDDIIPTKTFLSEHLRMHLRHPKENEAVLGLTLWHPKLKVTPFMRWLTNGSAIFGRFGGHQFAYEKLEGKTKADFNFFYTSNISLKKSLLKKYPFDSDFSTYGWEDIALGYQLEKEVDLQLYYQPKAIGYHDHMMTEESMARRMRNIGKSAWVIHKKFPELHKVPPRWKQFAFYLIGSWPNILFWRAFYTLSQGYFCNFYYYALSKKYFMEGLHKA